MSVANSNHTKERRFQINPVELLIFFLVSGIFINSVYKLFYDWKGLQTVQKASSPPKEEPPRELAAQGESLRNIEVQCQEGFEQITEAGKVRLSGPICGRGQGMSLLKTEIVNLANGSIATVFTDTNADKFSTDYIPLGPNRNPISLKFIYRDGKTVSQQITILKQ